MTKQMMLAGVALLLGACSADAGSPADLRETGAALYRAYCARCHGDDGSDTATYPGAKSLVDVTQRLSASEVIEKSSGFAAVRLDGQRATALQAHLETFRSGKWPNAHLLVETEWVEKHRGDAAVRLVDMRSDQAYAAGHIPGAVRIAEGPLRDPNDPQSYLPRPEAFAEMMGKAGIGSGTHVVIYDDAGGRSAARLWLVLGAYGHERVSLVNGGWSKWVAEKRPVSRDAPSVTPVKFTPRKVPETVCAAPEIVARRSGVVVLDTRSEAEFKGEQLSRGAKKAGRVPGSVNIEWKEAVTGPYQVFKPAPELKKLLESKGVTPDREVVTYCASGGRASHSLFTLKLMGYPKVRVYYGSFSDYTNRPDSPVEK